MPTLCAIAATMIMSCHYARCATAQMLMLLVLMIWRCFSPLRTRRRCHAAFDYYFSLMMAMFDALAMPWCWCRYEVRAMTALCHSAPYYFTPWVAYAMPAFCYDARLPPAAVYKATPADFCHLLYVRTLSIIEDAIHTLAFIVYAAYFASCSRYRTHHQQRHAATLPLIAAAFIAILLFAMPSLTWCWCLLMPLLCWCRCRWWCHYAYAIIAARYDIVMPLYWERRHWLILMLALSLRHYWCFDAFIDAFWWLITLICWLITPLAAFIILRHYATLLRHYDIYVIDAAAAIFFWSLFSPPLFWHYVDVFTSRCQLRELYYLLFSLLRHFYFFFLLRRHYLFSPLPPPDDAAADFRYAIFEAFDAAFFSLLDAGVILLIFWCLFIFFDTLLIFTLVLLPLLSPSLLLPLTSLPLIRRCHTTIARAMPLRCLPEYRCYATRQHIYTLIFHWCHYAYAMLPRLMRWDVSLFSLRAIRFFAGDYFALLLLLPDDTIRHFDAATFYAAAMMPPMPDSLDAAFSDAIDIILRAMPAEPRRREWPFEGVPPCDISIGAFTRAIRDMPLDAIIRDDADITPCWILRRYCLPLHVEDNITFATPDAWCRRFSRRHCYLRLMPPPGAHCLCLPCWYAIYADMTPYAPLPPILPLFFFVRVFCASAIAYWAISLPPFSLAACAYFLDAFFSPHYFLMPPSIRFIAAADTLIMPSLSSSCLFLHFSPLFSDDAIWCAADDAADWYWDYLLRLLFRFSPFSRRHFASMLLSLEIIFITDYFDTAILPLLHYLAYCRHCRRYAWAPLMPPLPPALIWWCRAIFFITSCFFAYFHFDAMLFWVFRHAFMAAAIYYFRHYAIFYSLRCFRAAATMMPFRLFLADAITPRWWYFRHWCWCRWDITLIYFHYYLRLCWHYYFSLLFRHYAINIYFHFAFITMPMPLFSRCHDAAMMPLRAERMAFSCRCREAPRSAEQRATQAACHFSLALRLSLFAQADYFADVMPLIISDADIITPACFCCHFSDGFMLAFSPCRQLPPDAIITLLPDDARQLPHFAADYVIAVDASSLRLRHFALFRHYAMIAHFRFLPTDDTRLIIRNTSWSPSWSPISTIDTTSRLRSRLPLLPYRDASTPDIASVRLHYCLLYAIDIDPYYWYLRCHYYFAAMPPCHAMAGHYLIFDDAIDIYDYCERHYFIVAWCRHLPLFIYADAYLLIIISLI